MKVFLASDHAGFELKNELLAYLTRNGYDVEDLGNDQFDKDDDYPQFAYQAVAKVLGAEDARAILVCGGGQGMAMAANRFKGIRAAVIWDKYEAKRTRVDNDSNVLSLPGRVLEEDEANEIVETWLNTEFSGAPRHKRRISELDEL